MEWPIATPRKKRHKIMIAGPPGCFKTRLALRLASNQDFANPSVSVIDTEFGTEWYAGDFAFRRRQTNDPTKIEALVKEIAANPGSSKTLILDTFSVYYDGLMEKWADLFLAREKTSAGHKGEYYTFQPKDYTHINKDAGKVVRTLLRCDMNVICICQIKAEWEGMKVVGNVFDGWKRLPYYFDTVIMVEEVTRQGGVKQWKAYCKGKDRSHSLNPGEIIPWENDEAIAALLGKKFGHCLWDMEAAQGYVADGAEIEEGARVPAAGGNGSKPHVVSAAVPDTPAKESLQAPVEPVDAQPAAGQPPEIEPRGIDNRPVGEAKLAEIIRAKKAAGILKDAWLAMVGKYTNAAGVPLTTAKDMTMDQANSLLGDIERMIP